MRLVLKGRYAVVVVWRGQALVVADHVPQRDPVAAAKPAGQLQGGGYLSRVIEDRLVGQADVLNPDRCPVQARRVAAAQSERDELIDPPAGLDEVVRACVGQLVELVGRA